MDDSLDSSQSDIPLDSPSDSNPDNSSSERESSSSSSTDPGKETNTRKRRRCVNRSNYLQGKCRKAYRLKRGLNQSLQDSPVSISGVCSSCAPSLAQISDGFKELKHRGSELKFAPDLLFSITAQDFYASDVFNERELVAVLERHASVVIDSGRIVRVWRETVTKKYGNLPGIRGLHDFLALRNSGQDAMMKVRESCYTGILMDTPMKITKGMSASDKAIPGVSQSYFALGMVKQLSESKQSHLNQMCANFIPQDRWHELANH